jgi:hypothetical protein
MPDTDRGVRAIPTLYAGVWFRSRLEARWAACFDELGWPWDYEPVDFGGWTPDFLIYVPGRGPTYAEVKPADSLAALKAAAAKVVCGSFQGQALCLGLGPLEDGRTLGLAVTVARGKRPSWRRVRTRTDMRVAYRAAANLTQWRPGASAAEVPVALPTPAEWALRAAARRRALGDDDAVALAWAARVAAVAAATSHPLYPGVLVMAEEVARADSLYAARYLERSIARVFLRAELTARLCDIFAEQGFRLDVAILPAELLPRRTVHDRSEALGRP